MERDHLTADLGPLKQQLERKSVFSYTLSGNTEETASELDLQVR